MSRTVLTYVDNTILTALVTRGPIGDAVRRWFAHTAEAWMSSEIALVRSLQTLEARRTQRAELHPNLRELLRALSSGIALRPLPLAALTTLQTAAPALHGPFPHRLAMADALELATALAWRCPLLITNNRTLRDAARAAGLSSLSIVGSKPAPASPPPAVGDWRGRSPIPP